MIHLLHSGQRINLGSLYYRIQYGLVGPRPPNYLSTVEEAYFIPHSRLQRVYHGLGNHRPHYGLCYSLAGN